MQSEAISQDDLENGDISTNSNLQVYSCQTVSVRLAEECLAIAKERRRQACFSFNLALIATAISACVSLAGAGLLLSGKAPEGVVAAAGGLASSVRCIQLANNANDRLDKTLSDLKDYD